MFTFIESIEDLAFLNEELLLKPYVGVDTEFRRTTKDNMRLALLQINDAEEIYLVDTVIIDDPKDLSIKKPIIRKDKKKAKHPLKGNSPS